MLKTCARLDCQVLYSSQRNGTYCPSCREIEDNAFHIIRDLLVEHPHASVVEIYSLTDIPLDIIERLVRSGRLKYVRLDQCTRCQGDLQVSSGKTGLCEACNQKLQAELLRKLAKRSAQASEKVRPICGMHVSSQRAAG